MCKCMYRVNTQYNITQYTVLQYYTTTSKSSYKFAFVMTVNVQIKVSNKYLFLVITLSRN